VQAQTMKMDGTGTGNQIKDQTRDQTKDQSRDQVKDQTRTKDQTRSRIDMPDSAMARQRGSQQGTGARRSGGGGKR